MNKKTRLAVFALFLGMVLFIGLLNGPFMMANIISPLALTAWLFLRIFVLSIHQGVYWWLLIGIGIIWLTHRFLGRPEAEAQYPMQVTNASLLNTSAWRDLIRVAASDRRLLYRTLQRNLIQMLITLYSSRQHDSTYTEVYEPLKQRQIPLPDPIYAFLFDADLEDTKLSLLERLRALPQLPRKWYHRWSGQETAEFYQSIETVLDFIETTLETPHDDQPE